MIKKPLRSRGSAHSIVRMKIDSAISFVAILTLCAANAGADTFSVCDENDFWGRWSDKYYTNHSRLAYTHDAAPGQHYFFAVGQEMYTPAARYVENPPANDHPYAAFLYASAGIAETRDDRTLLAAELQIGIVGPSALGEKTQDGYHRIIGADRYDGWDSQVKDQPGVNLLCEQRERVMLSGKLGEGFAADLIVRGFCSLGTVRTLFSGGAQARWGYGLPRDFGFAPMRQSTSLALTPGVPASLYVFADLQADALVYDATLGGELFRDHYSDVYAYPFAAEATIGVGASFDGWSVVLFQSFRTRDFSSADHHVFAFGGFRASYSF